MIKKIILGTALVLVVFFLYPSLLIQLQRPSLRSFILDVISLDKDRSICFNKAKNAIPPKSSYISNTWFGKSPIVINILRWGNDIEYSSADVEFGYSTEICNNHPMLDTTRGTSAILSLDYNSNGKKINIGVVEVVVISNVRKKSSDPDNYDQIFQKYASEFKLKQISQQEYDLEVRDDEAGVQILGVNYSPKLEAFIAPRFVTRDSGQSWKFESTHY